MKKLIYALSVIRSPRRLAQLLTNVFNCMEVKLDGDEATIHCPKGGDIVIALVNEEIDDPRRIDAYGYQREVYWEPDADGLD